MGWLTSGLSLLKKAAPVASMVPGLGTVAAGVGLASTAYGAYKGITGGGARSGVPPLPMLPGQEAPGGLIPFVPRGAGGKMQLPWNDPKVAKGFKQGDFGSPVLDDAFLRVCFKAPKGYVVVRDEKGRPYPMRRDTAIAQKMWKPSRKPPISAGDWHALGRANKVVNKLKTMERMVKKVANFKSAPRKQIVLAPTKYRKAA